ncbi:radical SAM protein [bacterium]|nr:radical SAM protein [bacterium]
MPAQTPYLVVANAKGDVTECPPFLMMGDAGGVHAALPDHLIPLPPGSVLYSLPGRTPVAFSPALGREVVVQAVPGVEGMCAVGAFVAPAYTQLMRPAYETEPGAQALPLYCYTAVGWRNGRFWVPAVRVDDDPRQDARGFDEKAIARGARRLLREFPRNRLVRHLMDNCCMRYRCPAARNFALRRWELPLPTARACNSRCIGCISLQTDTRVCAPQERIAFTPSPDEIAEISVPHLERAERPIVSFGQGCEGEPLTEFETLAAAIKLIRTRTRRGTINLNTNASWPERVETLFNAGLDTMRVSMNSARARLYKAYFRPSGYSFRDVISSIRIARRMKRFVSINYFVFPGFTDQENEWRALSRLLADPGVDMIQWRNLNIDPEWYVKELRINRRARRMGMLALMDAVRREFPRVRFGYYNPPVRDE